MTKKFFFTTVIFCAIFSAAIHSTLALEVTCASGSCTKDTTDPLFSELNTYPTWGVTRTIKANNNYAETRKFAVNVSNPRFFDLIPNPLEKVLKINIVEQESGNMLYGPATLLDFKNAGQILLSDVPSGGNRTYKFNLLMDNVGNEYQDKEIKFDLIVGFDMVQKDDNNDSEDGGDDEDSDEGDETGGTVAGSSTFLGGITSFFAPFIEEVPEVAGLETSQSTPTLPEIQGSVQGVDGDVAGASLCKDPWWWFLIFAIQIIVSLAIYFYISKDSLPKSRRFYILGALVNLPAVLVYWKYFCPWWDWVLSGIFAIVGYFIVNRRFAGLDDEHSRKSFRTK